MKFPILIPNIFNYPFTYESKLNLKIGDFVEVPFGKSKKIGVVWDYFENDNNKNYKIPVCVDQRDGSTKSTSASVKEMLEKC